jgi:probable F420-dependent oxidoreductase
MGRAGAERCGPGPGGAASVPARQTAAMDIGVIFPQTEVGGDRDAVRAIGEAVADLGYSHLAAYDHVLGADTSVHGELGGPYTIADPFREPLTMFAYLAGCTDLAFATSILIGPQRQTALLAKQAAELDLLTNGRFRLGLGIGWNKVEYDVLGMPFHERGALLEEQVTVLRALWTQPSVTFDGRFHHIRAAGLAPLPVQRPIPIWIGGHAPAALRRVGRIADGWFPQVRPSGGLESALDIIREAASEAGRDVSNFEFEGRVEYATRDHDKMAEHARRWRAAGASHLSLNTMHAGLESVDAHIGALTEMAAVLL